MCPAMSFPSSGSARRAGAVPDGAERAVARAVIAEDQERRVAGLETLGEVRASGRRADRVQPEPGDALPVRDHLGGQEGLLAQPRGPAGGLAHGAAGLPAHHPHRAGHDGRGSAREAGADAGRQVFLDRGEHLGGPRPRGSPVLHHRGPARGRDHVEERRSRTRRTVQEHRDVLLAKHRHRGLEQRRVRAIAQGLHHRHGSTIHLPRPRDERLRLGVRPARRRQHRGPTRFSGHPSGLVERGGPVEDELHRVRDAVVRAHAADEDEPHIGVPGREPPGARRQRRPDHRRRGPPAGERGFEALGGILALADRDERRPVSLLQGRRRDLTLRRGRARAESAPPGIVGEHDEPSARGERQRHRGEHERGNGPRELSTGAVVVGGVVAHLDNVAASFKYGPVEAA